MPVDPGAGSPSGQSFGDDVMELLRNDRMRGFLIDVETDSTIQPDENAEKQRRVEFITAVGQFMGEAAQILPGAPALAPMISEAMLFLVRGFRAGRSLEDVIERSLQQLQVQLQQHAANPPPSPEMMKAQAAQVQAQIDLQSKQQQAQLDSASRRQDLVHQAQLNQMELAQISQKNQLQAQSYVVDAQARQQKLADEAAMSELQRQNKQREFDDSRVMAAAQAQDAYMANQREIDHQEQLDNRAADHRINTEKQSQSIKEHAMPPHPEVSNALAHLIGQLTESHRQIAEMHSQTHQMHSQAHQQIQASLAQLAQLHTAQRRTDIHRDPKTGKITHATSSLR